MPTSKGFKHSPKTIAHMKFAQKRRWAAMTPEQHKQVIENLKRAHKHTPCPEERKRMLREKYSGPNSFAWKGGRHVTKAGYVYIYAPDCPFANRRPGRKGYVLEHRMVMSKMLGRPLDRYDIVHHKNRIKSDNRPENLEHLRGDNMNARSPCICPKCGYAF